MTQYENVFLSLLRAGLWGSAPEVPADFHEWGSVVRLAKVQSVLGIVGRQMSDNPQIAAAMGNELKARVKKFVLTNVYTHSVLNNCLVRVIKELHENDIDAVLLKGQGLARNYPVPELRQCGDIDLYVGTAAYLKACDVLGKIATWTDDADPRTTVKHWDLKVGVTTIEIHRFSDVNASMHYNSIYQAYSDDGLTRNLVPVDFGGVTVNTPSDTFNSFYIFNHLWHHFLTSGVGLRQLCDWMCFLHRHRAEIDVDALRRLLEDMDLLKPWRAFGCILTDYLGLPAEDFPLYDASQVGKRDRIMHRILEEGNFGREREVHKHRPKRYLFRKAHSLLAHITRDMKLFLLFPWDVSRQFKYTLSTGISTVWKDLSGKK